MPANDHDILVRIDEKLTSLHTLFAAHQVTDLAVHGDMENRIRQLEATKQSQKGAITVITTVVSAFWALVLACIEAYRTHTK